MSELGCEKETEAGMCMAYSTSVKWMFLFNYSISSKGSGCDY